MKCGNGTYIIVGVVLLILLILFLGFLWWGKNGDCEDEYVCYKKPKCDKKCKPKGCHEKKCKPKKGCCEKKCYKYGKTCEKKGGYKKGGV